MFSTPVLARNRPHRQRAIAASVAKYPSHSEAVAAVLAVYERATDQEIADGTSWYGQLTDQVLADIMATSAAHGRPIARRAAAGILAALSPATGWGDNVAGALEFVSTGNMVAQTPNANGKAARILAGEDPFAVLGGRKVRSFFSNIEEPNAIGAVTVDRHALSILFGRPLDEREQKYLLTLGAYTYAAAAYRGAARKLGIAPHVLQAITWIAWRNENPYRGRNADLAHNTEESF